MTEPMVDSLQAMVASVGARLAARRDRIHPTSLLVLVLASATAFALSLVVWVILDLNQPYRGWMRISQEPLERLAAILRS